MIRHVVVWTLAATDEQQKAADAAAIVEALSAVAPQVPGVLAFTIGPNAAYFDANWDIALVADFDSVESLGIYQTHPAHLAAVVIVKERVTQRAAVDFEL